MEELLSKYPGFAWIIITALLLILWWFIKNKLNNFEVRIIALEDNGKSRIEAEHQLELQIAEMNTCIVKKLDALKEDLNDKYVNIDHCALMHKNLLDEIKKK